MKPSRVLDQIPILMMHGTRDRIVPSKHYKSFASKCKLKEVENFSLIEVDQGDHDFYFKNKDNLLMVSNYFEKMLKNAKNDPKMIKNDQK